MTQGGLETMVRPRPGGVAVRLAKDEADLAAMLALGRLLHSESRSYGSNGTRVIELIDGGNGWLTRDGAQVGIALIDQVRDALESIDQSHADGSASNPNTTDLPNPNQPTGEWRCAS